MEDLLEQIEGANELGLYYVVLFMSLAVPDMGGALEASNGQATPARYEKWVDSHLPGWSDPGAGKQLYRFRNSILHQGSGRPHERAKTPRLLFAEPGTGLVIHMALLDHGGQSAMVIDVPTFCREVLAAARDWLRVVQGTEPFERNFERFVRRHVEAVSPFIVG